MSNKSINIKKSNIQIIRNGVNLKTLVSKENFKKKYGINSKFILFVGRFSKSKGIETLVKSINLKLIQDLPNPTEYEKFIMKISKVSI